MPKSPYSMDVAKDLLHGLIVGLHVSLLEDQKSPNLDLEDFKAYTKVWPQVEDLLDRYVTKPTNRLS